jgi:hypothetical protein
MSQLEHTRGDQGLGLRPQAARRPGYGVGLCVSLYVRSTMAARSGPFQ